MSSNNVLLDNLGQSVKQLHDDSCDLLFRVEHTIKAKEAMGLVWDVKAKCSYHLTNCVTTAETVTAKLGTTISA
jgi:hypothetical protein